MPAISVRDIQVKDDSTCRCADLIAGTHGRGFWILDDLTPLRQMAELRAAQAPISLSRTPRCVSASALTSRHRGLPSCRRVKIPSRCDTRLFPPARCRGDVTLQILDGSGRIVRTYSSADSALEQDPRPIRLPTIVCAATSQAPPIAACHSTGPRRGSVSRRRRGCTGSSGICATNRSARRTSGSRGRGGHRCGAASQRAHAAAPWVPPGPYVRG